MTPQDADLAFKTKKTSEKICENIHIVANDPSLAFFRIQEHVRKVLQPISDKRAEVIQLQTNLQGHCYDMEYAVGAVKSVEHSEAIFKNIQEMIKTSIFLKQQLKYGEIKNKSKKESTSSSVYKRFSAHLTLDLPELPDFSGVMRETSQRVETMMTSTRDSHPTQSTTGELQRSHTTLH
ncbi:PREDICTED: protein MEF2BNB homolog isoform X1 [Rhagoletis zephyria]|uniref:protein MEF2BNB homolog isoform X1 n=1 Tax=Rhagoletis zephyria TaxID=28612 RepID=UPI0008116F6B|nr:PREDICTED: protein MEF2BNB homolog isoform X1 [Rhagoletis zephyria]XP_036321378.1 BLOC-1-related complex subunit 8 homolog isoform X1 [Rhagoletis pomonella]